MKTKTVLVLGGFTLFGLVRANAYFEQFGATNDLWDVRQGTVVTAHSAFDPYPGGSYDARDLFGGAFGANVGLETGAIIFADGQLTGFVHYVEWRTTAPVTVGSFKFYADEDMVTPLQRAVARFRLLAKSPSSSSFDLVLYDYTPQQPYNYVDASQYLLLAATIPAVTAQDFRAEFYDLGRTPYGGPRVVELDAFPPAGPQCTAAPPDLVGWWRAEGNANDAIDGLNGTLSNGVTFAAGNVGQAFSFNGVNGFVQVGARPELVMSNAFTVEAWIFPTGAGSGPVGDGIIISKEGEYVLDRVSDGTIRWAIAGTGPWTWTATPLVAPLNTWTHVAMVYDNGVTKIYGNGGLVQTNNGPSVLGDIYPTFNDFRIGGRQTTAEYFKGLIDEVAVYQRALTANEIQAIYNAGSAGKCVPTPPLCVPAPSGLVGWWQAEGDAEDAAGGLNGTLSGGAGFGPGLAGQAFSLDGVNDFVQVGDRPELVISNALTVEAWIYPTGAGSGPSGSGVIISKEGEYIIDRISNGTIRWSIAGPGPWDWIATPFVAPLNTWTHVALVYDNGVSKVYGNGSLVQTNNGPSVLGDVYPTLNDFQIGARQAVSDYFKGLIDEVAVYKRALTASEIAAIYGVGSAGKCGFPPAVLSQPASQAVPAGANVTFTVVAAGSRPLSYQWQFNTTNLITGATRSSLTLNHVQASTNGNYNVVVSNALGSTNSADATLTVTPAPPCAQPPTGLVGWWRAEGNALNDLDGPDGNLSGGAGFIAGMVGQAFNLDGVDGYVQIGAHPGLVMSNAFSLEAWIYPTGVGAGPDGDATIVSKEGEYILNRYGDGRIRWGVAASNPAWGWVVTSFVAPLNTWTHVALVYDNGVIRTYGNGSLVHTYNGSGPIGDAYPALNDFRIGGRQVINESFKGLIDEVAIYKRALTTIEISAIYAAGSAGKCGFPPAITSQPASQTVPAGANVTFTVGATGSRPLSYQWWFNATNLIAGATSASLTLTNVLPTANGAYSAVVTNPTGATNTSSATLTVNVPPCVSVPSNLIGWWRAEGDADDAASGLNGTLVGGAGFAAGKVGQAFSLDGVNDYVQIGARPELVMSNAFTAEAWIHPVGAGSGSAGEGIIINKEGEYEMDRTADGTIRFSIKNPSSPMVWTVTPLVAPANSWTHVALVFGGGVIKIYGNGSLVQSYTGPSTVGDELPAQNDFRIGGRQAIGECFKGLIDEVAIYRRALTASEIQALYTTGSAGKCLLPPSITSQPASQTVPVGSTVTFSVVAAGSTPRSYQWWFNGTNLLAGATNASLTLSNVQPAASGDYTIVVSNSVNATSSAPAHLSVRYLFAFGNGQNLTNAQYTFVGPVNVQLQTFFPNGTLFYTLDGSPPTFASAQYTGSFALSRSATLRVITYSADFLQSWELDPIALNIIPTYTLAASAPGGGTVSVIPPSGPYVSNTAVQVTANPASGWTFLGWWGDASGANPTINVTMNRNRFVQARFGTTLNTTVAGSGAVLLTPPGGFYPYGTVVQLHGVPQAGNYFVLWGNAGSGNNNPLNFPLTNANPTVSSLFAPLSAGQYTLTVLPDGLGQVSVDPAATTYESWQTVTVTALPEAGEQFLGWSGDAGGTNNPLSLGMTQSRAVVAHFTRQPRLEVRGDLNGLNDQGFRLTLTGEFGARYRIDGSTNLRDWVEVLTLTNAFGTEQVLDAAAANKPFKFYKARLVP